MHYAESMKSNQNICAESSGCAGLLRKTDLGEEVLAVIRRALNLEDSVAANPPRLTPVKLTDESTK